MLYSRTASARSLERDCPFGLEGPRAAVAVAAASVAAPDAGLALAAGEAFMLPSCRSSFLWAKNVLTSAANLGNV